ncbi:glycosyl hydrolase family 43 [Mangrovibacterium marinum]|uniref:Glycosyl hydrolase family 43 n=1 Tax=Mangrovibacterium marinum TaxID=1639118 RepID=A0A2T5BR19_9BACT|nr:glycosyl hydrolase family 43 [Mangrovibacterium marinum]
MAHGYGTIRITELNHEFTAIGPDSLVFTGDIRGGLEGMHVYKINDFYYLYGTYGGVDGIQVTLRSKNIYGPYEQKVVLEERTPGVNFGVHQGALIETQSGEWWTMLFVDSGPFGRMPNLQPVSWVDGWPMVGLDGKAVVTYRKPNVGKEYPVKDFPRSDEFEGNTLGMQWGWNHNPNPTKWSLTEHSGYLRLKTAKVVADLLEARNTLTQRPFAHYNQAIPSVATTQIDVTKMKNGDIAGLGIFQEAYAFIAVKQVADEKQLVMVNKGDTIASISLKKANSIYLRTTASNKSRLATFEYSYDNQKFDKLGNELRMSFSLKMFTGNKFCLFNYATKEIGGYVDFDWFRVE